MYYTSPTARNGSGATAPDIFAPPTSPLARGQIDCIASLRVRLDGPDGATFTLKGRVAWALAQLITAGAEGCTPIQRPAPRWSDYIFKIRAAGVAVETLHEVHKGPYAGSHGRYLLRSPLTVLAATFAEGGAR
jgi:hypothetical protein